MPDASKNNKPGPKSENLVIALLPPRQRFEAQNILNKNDGESARLLNRIITRENARVRLLSGIIVLPVSLLLIKAAPMSEPPWYIAVLVSMILTLLVSAAITCRSTRLETVALETLAQGNDAQFIGPLLEVWQKRNLNEPLRELIKQALARLLPQCTQEIFDRLTPLQRRSLYGILNLDMRPSHLGLHLDVLDILGQWGDKSCLGVLYRQATVDSASPLVRNAAQNSVEAICRRLDFGSLTRLPEYADYLRAQLYPSGLDYRVCATCIMALRRMVPQLTPDNYKSILPDRQRDRLYQLLTEASLYGNYRYGKQELFLEIIASAGRLKDMRSIRFLQKVAQSAAPTSGAKQMRVAAGETLRLLEAEVEKQKESKTLLRGASVPASQAEELLRAAAPAASVTDPEELLRPSTVEMATLPRTQASGAETEVDLLLQSRNSG